MSRPRMVYLGVLGYFFGWGLFLPVIGSGKVELNGVDWVKVVLLGSPIVWLVGMAVGAAALDGAEHIILLIDRLRSKEETRTSMLRGALLVAGIFAYGLWLAIGTD